MREIVDKQPGLKTDLKEYVLKKAGNKARVAGFRDIFGDDDVSVGGGGSSVGGVNATEGRGEETKSESPAPSRAETPPLPEDAMQGQELTPVSVVVETPVS